ncbi:MAG: hypothetical protein HY900_23990 [Deltaproteobacteria bacterium]|nr:hypothetical protein [Deltaproteobacteria bacterium]
MNGESCDLCEDMMCEETCEGDEVFGIPLSTTDSRARARAVRTIGEHVLKVLSAPEPLNLDTLLASLRRQAQGSSADTEPRDRENRVRAEAAIGRLLDVTRYS